MDIIPPFGYGPVTPYLRDQRVRLLKTGEFPAFASTKNALPVTLGELMIAGHDCPIVFVPNPQGDSHVLVEIVGFTDGENLLMDGGQWRENAYVPAYIRRYPFCMTRVAVNGVQQSQRIVCVEQDRIDPDGTSFFDAEGKPDLSWTQLERFINEYEADLQRTIEVCKILTDFKLLEPFNMQSTIGEEAYNLTGMVRVDERKLEFLTASELKTLVRKGAMGVIYQHLASLTRFQHLINMKARRTQATRGAAAGATAKDEEPVTA
jgi:hypothetical protein